MADDCMADEEDVIFENSPLEKYLKDAGFVNFEPERVKSQNVYGNELFDEDTEGSESKKSRSHFGVKEWLISFVKRSFSFHYHVDRSLLLRKEYAWIVFSAGIMSEDDITFLQQFHSELFDIPDEIEKDQGGHSLFYNKMMSSWNKVSGNLLSFLILFMAVLLSSNLWKHLDGIWGIVASFLTVAVISYYLWHRQRLKWLHIKNVQILSHYVDEVKHFLMVFRKSIMLIQELELISKGYTLVGLGMQIGYNQSNEDQDNINTDIYPMLRQCLLKSGIKVLTPSCIFVKGMAASNPLASEVNNVFTYISDNPLSHYGLDKYCEHEKLSLQYLKILLSAVASQQSELLSRYLISMSENTRMGQANVFPTFHFLQKLHLGFYDQKRVVDIAFESLKLSYHLHKSSLTFSGNENRAHESTKHRVKEANTKWTKYYTAIHSLELHLKACLTRTQAISTFLMTEMESENDVTKNIHKDNPISELESANKGLRMELDSCVSCLEEGVYNLTLLSGADESNNANTEDNNSSDETQGEYPLDYINESNVEQSEEKVGDCVFEAFTDIFDENDSQSPLLTREELERESRSREESKHLLVELKNVLVTKVKDPLITDKGFVKPAKRQDTESDDNNLESIEPNKTDCKGQDDNNEFDKDTSSNVGVDSSMITKQPMAELITENRSKIDQPLPCVGQYPSRAFSSAIQAAAMSRGVAMEESYGSSDSD